MKGKIWFQCEAWPLWHNEWNLRDVFVEVKLKNRDKEKYNGVLEQDSSKWNTYYVLSNLPLCFMLQVNWDETMSRGTMLGLHQRNGEMGYYAYRVSEVARSSLIETLWIKPWNLSISSVEWIEYAVSNIV